MANDSQVSNKFLQKLEEKRAAERAAKEQQQNDLLQWAEFVPDIDLDESPGLSDQEKTFDEFISFIKITEAYQRWGGKSLISNTNKEEIKVRCPNPNHKDEDPSFVMNTQKNVFNCFKCGGGDIYDIAAWHFGFPVPGYKDKAHFRNLKDNILADYGMQVQTSLAGETTVVQVEVPRITETSPPTPQVTNVSYTPEGAGYAESEDDLEPKRLYDAIDWRSFIPENTFLRAYMEAATTDTSPEEFHFWLGMVALGLAVGRNVTLRERNPVLGNLFVCLTGPSGTGKSRAKRTLAELLRDNLPYKKTDPIPTGVSILPNPSSGEIVVKYFQHEILDVNGRGTGSYLPVKMLLTTEELADIMTKSSRHGNSLKGTMLDMYDCPYILASNSLTNPLTVESPFGSVVTTTQNQSIRDLITKKDDNAGFINRWIFATGVEKSPVHIDRSVLDLTRAGGLIRIINSSAANKSYIDWDNSADELYKNFFHSRIIPIKKTADSKILERIDLTMKKVFLLLAINKKKKIVESDTVQEGLNLWDYLCESYGVIEKQIAATDTGDDQDFVLRTIQRMSQNGTSPTASHIYKAAKHRIQDVGQVRKMLENFCALGIVTEFKKPAGPSGGRPTTVYLLAK